MCNSMVRFVQTRAEKLLRAGEQEAAQMRQYSLRALQLVIQDMAADKYGSYYLLYVMCTYIGVKQVHAESQRGAGECRHGRPAATHTGCPVAGRVALYLY